MKRNVLRVGLLLDGNIVSAWQHKMFENILQSNYAEIVLVVLNTAGKNNRQKTLVEKIRSNYGQLTSIAVEKSLDKLYRLLIERQHTVPNASAKLDSSGMLEGIPHLNCDPIQTQWSDRFSEADIEKIRKNDLDILIRCGFRILRGDILTAARYGIWSFHHGDNRLNRGGPAGFWESMESWPVNGSILQILNEDLDNGTVLYRSFSSTSSMSVTDNRSRNKWKSLQFMTRMMELLYNEGPDVFFQKVELHNVHPEMYSQRLYVIPGNVEMAKLLCKKTVEKVVNLYRNNVYLTQWILMYDIKDSFSSSLWRYKKIMPPKDRFYADPHVIQRDGTYYIFIEEYIFGSNRGFISLIEMDEKGQYQEPVPILNRPYHLSYPFVFEHQGDYYMVPETEANRTVELYKCVEFPHRWEFHMTLLEGIRAGDATLHYHSGRWWLFATVSEIKGASLMDELWIFSSPQLLSQNWEPHPQNPVVSDCTNARPAGRLFRKGDRIYRPAQNCSYRYGYGFNFNEVITLNETEYVEKTVTRAEPNWDRKIIGTHTFSREGSLHIVDASYRRNRFRKNG